MQEGVPNLSWSPSSSADLSQGSGEPTGPQESPRPHPELSTWLEQVGTLQAIAAILETERRRQQTPMPQPSGTGGEAMPVLAAAIKQSDWLADAVRTAFAQLHGQAQPLENSGEREPATTIPLELHLTPAQPQRPHQEPGLSASATRRWIPVGQVSIRRPAHDAGASQQFRPQQPANHPGAERTAHNTWRPLSTQQLRAHLLNFLAGPVAAGDIQAAVAGLMAWWKLHEPAIGDADRSALVAQLHVFISNWLEEHQPSALVGSAAGGALPGEDRKQPTPELEPTIYSSNDVARLLNYTDSTIRRSALRSWRHGPGPHPLRGIPGFYVVARPNPSCGRARGWKFQRKKAAANGTTQPNRTPINTRLALHDEHRRMRPVPCTNNHHGGTPSSRR